MATSSVTRSLPRFLLPGLSWSSQTTPLTIRTFSTLPFTHKPSSEHRKSSQRRVSHSREGNGARTTSILQNSAHRRAFQSTARQYRDHHFDTLKFVQRLKEEGFTEAQSVAMMKVLSDVIEERLAVETLRLLYVSNLSQHSELDPDNGSP